MLLCSFSIFAQTKTKGLKDYYLNYFPVGVAVTPRMMDDGDESSLILTQFNSITTENAMKMGPIHPEENRYNFAPVDKIVDFAQKIRLKCVDTIYAGIVKHQIGFLQKMTEK